MDIANAFGLKGMVENLLDGRVLIIAEGEDKKLVWFEDAIDIKNTLIKVSSIEKEYSSAGGEFDDFGKLVFKGETDARLDAAAVRLEKLIDAVNNMNDNLGGKIDRMNENLSGKMDKSLAKQDRMLEKQDELLVEVKDMNRGLNDKIDKVLDKRDIAELKADVSEVKAALRAKGMI